MHASVCARERTLPGDGPADPTLSTLPAADHLEESALVGSEVFVFMLTGFATLTTLW